MKKLAITVIMMVIIAVSVFAATTDSKTLQLYFDVAETLSVCWTENSYTGSDYSTTEISEITNVNFGEVASGSTVSELVYATYKTNAEIASVSVGIDTDFSDENLVLGISKDGLSYGSADLTFSDDAGATSRIVSNPVYIQVEDNGAAKGEYTATLIFTVTGA